MSTREHASVSKLTYEIEDHGILTSFLHMEIKGGSQGFGGLALDERTGEIWKAQLAELFSVRTFEEIEGRSCYVLRCWDTWNTPIEGLEVDGKRFTITKFRRYCWPELNILDPLEMREKELRSSIRHIAKRIERDMDDLEEVRRDYVDWNKL